MANYYGTGRTTYARFKSVDAVNDLVRRFYGVKVIDTRAATPGDGALLAFMDDNDDGGGWHINAKGVHCPACAAERQAGGLPPWTEDDPEGDYGCEDHPEYDFWEELARLMCPGQAIAVSEAGAEKYRYVHGYVAVYAAVEPGSDDQACVESVSLSAETARMFAEIGFTPEQENY